MITISAAPWSVFAADFTSDTVASEDTVYVLAGSDFQPSDDNVATGRKQVKAILDTIKKAGYTKMDGFLFAGDYDLSSITSVAESLEGKKAVQAEVQAAYGTDMHEVYVKGNHDPIPLVTNGDLSPSGANDTDHYGVFVINENDYMWGNTHPNTILTTADSLEEYLDAKLADGYEKPIFIISHLPLHYSMRTYTDGDAQYANYLFDVINAAGKAGLQIVFLFGHDHAHGWDDYLGGASVYLQVGDSIHIAQASREEVTVETLAFTYMNAGYVGCYAKLGSGVDPTLTMTVFAITDDRVRIERYSADGIHPLKSPGAYGAEKNGDYEKTAYLPNTTVYTSPQTVYFRSPQTATDGAVTATAHGLTSIRAIQTEEERAGYRKYVEYDIGSDELVPGDTATVVIRVEEGYDTTVL